MKVKDFNLQKAPTRMENIVKGALSVLGYGIEKEGMHTLRRSGARGYYDDLELRSRAGEILPDSPIRIVQQLLGHQQQDTTEGYLGIAVSRKARDTMMKNRAMIEKRIPQPEQAPIVAEEAPMRRLSIVR